MARDPSGADGSEYLTPGELAILAAIESDFDSNDSGLAYALRTGVAPVPRWLLVLFRVGLSTIVLVLLLPASSIAALMAAVAMFWLLRPASNT